MNKEYIVETIILIIGLIMFGIQIYKADKREK